MTALECTGPEKAYQCAALERLLRVAVAGPDHRFEELPVSLRRINVQDELNPVGDDRGADEKLEEWLALDASDECSCDRGGDSDERQCIDEPTRNGHGSTISNSRSRSIPVRAGARPAFLMRPHCSRVGNRTHSKAISIGKSEHSQLFFALTTEPSLLTTVASLEPGGTNHATMSERT